MRWNYRFTMQIPFDSTDDQLLFIKQLGVERVYSWLPADRYTLAELRAFQQRVADSGLILHNMLSGIVSKHPAIHLALPGRDKAIGQFEEWLRWLREIGLKNTTFTWEANQTLSSGHDAIHRFSKTRYVNSADMQALPMAFGREYTRDELWDNFAYFMEKIIPVAEETNVRLALHPVDPPVEFSLGGIPALIHNYSDYKKAFAIANSHALGMEFCCGCWLEGGTDRFGDILHGLTECLKDDRVIILHFRNITRTLPDFVETFLDSGYFEMYKIMRILCKHQYDGVITPDHLPVMADGSAQYGPRAYAIGYMRALAERAMAEPE